MKIVKKNLIDRVSVDMKLKKHDAKAIIESLLGIVFEEVSKGNKVVLSGIGTLLPVLHKAKKSGSVVKGQSVIIPATLRVRLVSSKLMKYQMKKLIETTSLEQ